MPRASTLIALPLALLCAGLDADRATPAAGAQDRATYENPVLPGDYPDPSVIRVGKDYWATATTSQWAPIFPLLHSTDLVNWRLVSSVFQSPPGWSAGSYWASEIAEDGGRFFVYYTARRKDGPLCVAVADAARPEGPYTDHGPLVCQDAGSIDAVPVRDENGRRHLVWKEDGNSRKQPTPLWAQPLSDDGLRLEGTRHELLRNEAAWEAHVIEGPFFVRRNGWFYLFYSADACCGRKCNYKLGVARSRTLLGPWERHPSNPILAANEHWTCPGHGSIVEDPTGRTFLLYHAYHPVSSVHVGRQGLLDEVTWQADGWPSINGGSGPSHTAPLPPGAARTERNMTIADDFAAGALDPAWQWPWDQEAAPVVDPDGGGRLRIRTASARVAIAGRPAPAGRYTASTIVDVGSVSAGAQAGLAAFGNRDNILAVTVDGAGPGPQSPLTVTVWRQQKEGRTVLATRTLDRVGALHLRMRALERTRFELAASPDGRDWTVLTSDAEGASLPPWDLAVRVALIVAGRDDATAAFGRFQLEPAAD